MASEKGSIHTTEKANEKYNPGLVAIEDEDLYQREVHDAPLKLDSQGLPLIPQPSSWPDDPLNYRTHLYLHLPPYSLTKTNSYLVEMAHFSTSVNPSIFGIFQYCCWSEFGSLFRARSGFAYASVLRTEPCIRCYR